MSFSAHHVTSREAYGFRANAFIPSPLIGCGNPTTAVSATASWLSCTLKNSKVILNKEMCYEERRHNSLIVICYHSIFDFRCPQSLATNIDDVIHPSCNPVVAILVTQCSVASEIVTLKGNIFKIASLGLLSLHWFNIVLLRLTIGLKIAHHISQSEKHGNLTATHSCAFSFIHLFCTVIGLFKGLRLLRLVGLSVSLTFKRIVVGVKETLMMTINGAWHARNGCANAKSTFDIIAYQFSALKQQHRKTCLRTRSTYVEKQIISNEKYSLIKILEHQTNKNSIQDRGSG